MRAQSDKLQHFRIGFALNQKQIRFEVAFAMVSQFASKSMIAVLVGQRLVLG
jgi:hypothetical protein